MTNQEKIAKDKKQEQERAEKAKNKPQAGYVKTATIHQKFPVGKSYIRPVGDFVETHTHNLSPNSFGSIGVADKAMFKGKDFIPFEVPCIDWNILLAEKNSEYTCPFCKLYYRASKMLKRKDLTPEEKKTFEAIKTACAPSRKVRWNDIDRNDPTYIRVKDGKETKVRGLKLASFSKALFKDIKGIFEQTGLDLSDPETGIDLVIDRAVDANNKTTYSAFAAMERTSVKITPLTDEEKSWTPWDIVDMYSKPYDFNKIEPVMHADFRELLSYSDEDFAQMVNSENEGSGDESSEAEEEVESKPEVSKPVSKKKLNKRQEQETEPDQEQLPF